MKNRNFSISSFYFISLNVVILVTVLISFTVIIQSSYSRFENQLSLFKDSLYQSRREDMIADVESAIQLIDLERTKIQESMEEELVHNISNARDIIDFYYQNNRNHLSQQDMLSNVAEMFRPFRFFEGEGYYFMFTGDGREVLYPVFPEKEGLNNLDWVDSEGVYFCREMIEKGRQIGHGFIEYKIARPGVPQEDSRKIAYFIYYAPLDLIVGSGYYLDHMEDLAKKEAARSLDLFGENREDPFFGADYHGVALIGSNRGINRISNPVGDSAEIIADLTAIAKEGGGFYEYMMPPLDKDTQEKVKLSYVLPYPDWGWYIGTGTYLHNFSEIIEMEQKLIRKDMLDNIKMVLAGLLAIYVVLVILIRYLSKPIRNVSSQFVDALEDAVENDHSLQLDKIPFKEFHSIAHQTNRILEAKKESQQALFQKQKLEAIGRLAGGIAHDVNNQLTAVMGYADLISTHHLNDEIQSYLAELLEGAYQASNMVQELLRFSRKGDLVKQRVNIHEILGRVQSILEHTISKDIKLRLDMVAQNPHIEGDENRIYSLFLNLALNSVDSFDKGGIIILSSRNLEKGTTIQLEIRDNGSGIEPQHLDNIFDLFFTTKPPGKGTGLGLALVYDIVKDHKGTISVDSELGKGTCFRISFPVME